MITFRTQKYMNYVKVYMLKDCNEISYSFGNDFAELFGYNSALVEYFKRGFASNKNNQNKANQF